MAAIKIFNFGGSLPAYEDHLLPDGQATIARDCYLLSGALTGWRQPKLLRALTDPTAKYAYRIPNRDTNDTTIDAPDSIWLEFPDIDTNVIPTPVVDDQFKRYYIASASDLPKYNTYDGIVAGSPPWLLGVPAPTVAPDVQVTGSGSPPGLIGPIQGAGPEFTPVGFPANTIVLTQYEYNAGTVFAVNIVTGFPAQSDGTPFPGSNPDQSLQMRAVFYSDDNGVPGTLLTQGPSMAPARFPDGAAFTVTDDGLLDMAGADFTINFDNPPTMKPGTKYWAGLMTNVDIVMELPPPDSVNFPGVNLTWFNSASYSNGAPPIFNFFAAGGYTSACVDMDLSAGNFADVISARAYVYTWVTTYGEEGPPSPPTLVNGTSGGIWSVSVTPPDPLDQGTNRTIETTRIYRTVSSTTGQTTYYLVAEIPATQTDYTDVVLDDVIAVQPQLASYFWFPPPDDLQGIVSVPNGVTAGWRDNELWFSEVYRPHAWPPGYVLTTEFPIVGLGVCGQSIVVCTEGTPYVVNGVAPGSMSMSKVLIPEPCVSRGSIIGNDMAAMYQSPNGIIEVLQSGQGQNITEQWVPRQDWQQLVTGKDNRAIQLTVFYFSFSPSTADGFTISTGTQITQNMNGFVELSPPNPGLSVDNVLHDPWTGIGMLVQAGSIYFYDYAEPMPTMVPYKWRSKTYQMLAKRNMAAMKVFFSVPPGTPHNLTRNVAAQQPTLDAGQYGIVRVYADGNLLTTREIWSSGELLRINSGGKFEDWAFEIESRVTISNIQCAESVKELGGI
jgi:hypothetical protein